MFAEPGDTFIPVLDMPKWVAPTLEDLRERGQIVSVDPATRRATVQYTQGLVVSYHGVFLDENWQIERLMERPVNRYAQAVQGWSLRLA